MTTFDKDSVMTSALGNQLHSSRKSAPSFTISKVGRKAREAVFISQELQKNARLGRESPKDARYNIPSAMQFDATKAPTFGNGNRADFTARKIDPDDVPTNDALGILPDSQICKYRRDPTIVIGTEPRGKLKDAALLKSHAAAFFGRSSPGPASVGGEFGPDWKCTKPKMAPAVPFGIKPKGGLENTGSNPPDVGPGRHEPKDGCLGKQILSNRANHWGVSFATGPKLPKHKYNDAISELDAARSCFGKQVLNKNKSEPSVGFCCDTRDTRSRTKLCMTKLDEGPKAVLPKAHFTMPNLPSERTIMSVGFG